MKSKSLEQQAVTNAPTTTVRQQENDKAMSEKLCVVNWDGTNYGFLAYDGGHGDIRTYDPGHLDPRLYRCRTFRQWKPCAQYLSRKASREGFAYAALPVAVAREEFGLGKRRFAA